MSEHLPQSSSENVDEAAVSGVDPMASDQRAAVTSDTNAQIAAAVPIEVDETAEDSGYGESDT